jgi:hypothetical protein
MRSLAERARGLAAISSGVGGDGRAGVSVEPRASGVDLGRVAAGAGGLPRAQLQEALDDAILQRMKGDHGQHARPGFSARSAASSPATSSPNSSFTAMRSA